MSYIVSYVSDGGFKHTDSPTDLCSAINAYAFYFSMKNVDVEIKDENGVVVSSWLHQ